MKQTTLHITIPPDLLAIVKQMAVDESRNVSNMTTVLIKRGLEKNKTA